MIKLHLNTLSLTSLQFVQFQHLPTPGHGIQLEIHDISVFCYTRLVQAKKKRLEQLQMARIIQRIYRGMLGRRGVDLIRIERVNAQLTPTKRRATEET
jgi:hypothetical protein